MCLIYRKKKSRDKGKLLALVSMVHNTQDYFGLIQGRKTDNANQPSLSSHGTKETSFGFPPTFSFLCTLHSNNV